jgi:hypothetical protein
MMRTFAYFISLLVISFSSIHAVNAQDTILVPLKIKAGLEVSGFAIHKFDTNIMNTEGYLSVDLNEKISVVLAGGYLKYEYSQYNYTYLNNGMFLRAGLDFNLLKPDKSQGKYWAGIGLRYGLSVFNSQIPSFEHTDYWGTTSSSIAQNRNWAHFIEVDPGVRTEIFKNFSMGWTISLRMLLYSGTGKDVRPIYFPGFGNGTNTISTGINYFIVWSIPYKKINVIMKKDVPEETGDTGTLNNPGTGQQPIRQ